jgi:nucleobase transporter 1/2
MEEKNLSLEWNPRSQQILNVTDAPPPPVHTINRGIMVEGLGTIVAGLFGTGNGTNTFGENVAAIGVTKVINRL